MQFLGNLLWLLCFGLWFCLGWVFFGVLWCITIIGIPVGLQCFKMAQLSLSPFGKEIEYSSSPFSLLINILWIFIGGAELALYALIVGLIFCITIVGIPFGLQCFKFAQLALFPFGAQIVEKS